MAEERTVSARLDIHKTGDTDAFKEAAGEVKQLAETTGSSGDKILDFYVRLANAAEDLKAAELAGDTKAQTKALQEMALAWAEALPPDLDLSFKRVGDSVRDLTDKVLATERAQGALGSSSRDLAREYLDVADSVGRLEQAVSSSFAGANQRVAEARVELNAYRRSLEEAKQEGQGIGAAEIAQLERLEARYATAVESVGRYRAAQKQAARDIDAAAAATEQEIGSIRSLDTLITKAVPSWGRYVGAAGAIVGVFGAAYAAGTKLRDVLNDLSDGAFDRFLRATNPLLIASQKLFDMWAESGPNAAGRLQREMELLRKHGIDPTGLSAEEVSRRVDELGLSMQKGSFEAAKARKDYEEFAKSAGLSEPELKKAADALATFIERFRSENAAPLPKETIDLFRGRIQQILDGYALLGREAPAALRALAREWEVLTSAEEEALAKHEEIVKRWLEAITGVVAGSREQLEAEAAALVVALESIDFDRIRGTQPEVFGNLQEQIRGLLDRFREAGQLIPDELGKWANAAGVVVYQWELVGTSALEAAGKVGQGTTQIIERVDETGKKVKEIVQIFAEEGAAGKAAGETAAEGQVRVIERVDETGKKVKEVIQVFDEAGDAGEDAGKKAATFFDEITVSATKSTPAVAAAAAAAQDAGEGLGTAADKAGELGGAAAAADANLQGLDERLKDIEDRLGQAEGALTNIASSLAEIGPAFASAFEPGQAAISAINASLDATAQKLAGVLAQLAQVQQGGGEVPVN